MDDTDTNNTKPQQQGQSSLLGLDVDFTQSFNFHGVTYVLTTRVRRRPQDGEEVLVVEAEQEHTDDRWMGEFTRQYVEEITTKTGNFKKFGVFVRMLVSALQQRSDSVFVDLLTYNDLEMLKARKMGQPSASQAGSSRGNNKRYLIMTYAVEFDRVHYPLPLIHDDNPSPEALRRTIRRLKQEIGHIKQGGSPSDPPLSGSPPPQSSPTALSQENEALKRDNTELRKALRKQTDEIMAVQRGSRPPENAVVQRLQQENESLNQEVQDLEESYEELRENSSQEMRKLRREAKQLSEQLRQQQTQASKKKPAGLSNEKEKNYQRQIADLETALSQERNLNKRLQAKHKKEMSELVKQLDKEVASGRVLRSRNRELQRKVAVLTTQAAEARRKSMSSSRASSVASSRQSSRANSTISSRYSSRNSSAVSSRVPSRHPSRNTSRDSSPRGPRGHLDTTALYGVYDERGVNVRRARGGGGASDKAAPRQPSRKYGERYQSPYAQRVRPTNRSSSDRTNGYLSAGSEGSRGSARSRRSEPAPRPYSPPLPRAHPPPNRRPSPTPALKAAATATTTNSIRRDGESTDVTGNGFVNVRRLTDSPPRVTSSGGGQHMGSRASRTEATGAAINHRSPRYRLLNDDFNSPKENNAVASNLPIPAASPASPPGKQPSPRPNPRMAWSSEGMEPTKSRATGKSTSATEEDNLRATNLPSAEIPSSKQPQGSGSDDGDEVVEGEQFDASSEIGEIDRRLNALQNFLKQAKNGIITRIPTGV